MKHISLLIISLLFISFAYSDNKKEEVNINEVISSIKHSTLSDKAITESTVLICTGKYSKRYHNSMCKGMKACKGERKRVSLSEAKKMGLTACGYCYK